MNKHLVKHLSYITLGLVPFIIVGVVVLLVPQLLNISTALVVSVFMLLALAWVVGWFFCDMVGWKEWE